MYKTDVELLARNLRIARAKLGISQKELAMRSGVGETSICFIENAKKGSVRMSTIGRLANALGIEVEELFKED